MPSLFGRSKAKRDKAPQAATLPLSPTKLVVSQDQPYGISEFGAVAQPSRSVFCATSILVVADPQVSAAPCGSSSDTSQIASLACAPQLSAGRWSTCATSSPQVLLLADVHPPERAGRKLDRLAPIWRRRSFALERVRVLGWPWEAGCPQCGGRGKSGTGRGQGTGSKG